MLHPDPQPDPRASRLAQDLTPVFELLGRTRRTVLDGLALAGHALSRLERLVIDLGHDSREVVTSAVAFWQTLEAAAQTAAATARATPRVARILKEIGRIATVYRLYHIKLAWISPEAGAAGLEALHQREAERLRKTLEEMGGGLLKVGQFLSCRADLLPPDWIAELKLLQDRVPAAPEAEVRALLASELAALWPLEAGPDPASPDEPLPLAPLPPLPPLPWFASFDPIPVAAASLAQVHRATLAAAPDHVVAVKVQRPGIDKLIAQDRRALALIAELLSPIVTQFDLVPVLAEISRSLDDELDFEAEAAHAERFAAALAPAHATIPTILARTSKVLVMDFIEGERLVPFLDAAATRGPEGLAERDQVLAALATATAESMLVHGLVHADPHPGNFLVTRDETGAPRLVLLDFGATVVLSHETRKAYAQLLPAMFGRNEPKVRELLLALGFSAPDPDAPAKFAMAIASTLIPTDLMSIDPRAELERGLALARLYPGMVVPGHFVQIGRALAGLGGLFLTYRPALDLGRILFSALARA